MNEGNERFVGNFIVGCILAACGLMVMVVLSLDPSIRQVFVQDYISWIATAAVLIAIASAIFLALIKWN